MKRVIPNSTWWILPGSFAVITAVVAAQTDVDRTLLAAVLFPLGGVLVFGARVMRSKGLFLDGGDLVVRRWRQDVRLSIKDAELNLTGESRWYYFNDVGVAVTLVDTVRQVEYCPPGSTENARPSNHLRKIRNRLGTESLEQLRFSWNGWSYAGRDDELERMQEFSLVELREHTDGSCSDPPMVIRLSE